MDDAGLRVDELAASGVPAVMLTPAHQFPTGVVLDGDRRRQLVAWARAGGLIIEDDYDAEHRYDRPPVPALRGLLPEQVCYAGSVSSCSPRPAGRLAARARATAGGGGGRQAQRRPGQRRAAAAGAGGADDLRCLRAAPTAAAPPAHPKTGRDDRRAGPRVAERDGARRGGRAAPDDHAGRRRGGHRAGGGDAGGRSQVQPLSWHCQRPTGRAWCWATRPVRRPRSRRASRRSPPPSATEPGPPDHNRTRPRVSGSGCGCVRRSFALLQPAQYPRVRYPDTGCCVD
ncbi:hypothetical protein NKG94_13130 [Micromonospora sp. M12]